MAISFKCSLQDGALIHKIAGRACHLALELRGDTLPCLSLLDITMDLTACHAASSLDLQALLQAPNADFWHDLTGISRHLDRDTGELGDCFVPRYTSRED